MLFVLDSTHNNYLVRDNRLIGSGMAQGGDTFTIACWVKKKKIQQKTLFLVAPLLEQMQDFWFM